MERITFRGREQNLLTVGKAGPYAFNTISAALDSISDNEVDNPYVISLQRDIVSEIVELNKSHVSLVGEDKWASILQRPISDTSYNGGLSGGTMQVGNDTSSLTENVLIYNLHIIRPSSGDTTQGQPPEGGLYIGPEETFTQEPCWNNIWVLDNVIEGVHDGIQWFGCAHLPVGYTGSGNVPNLYVIGNTIKSTHDASTYKGNTSVFHAHNKIYINTAGIEPWLTSIRSWKTNGFHLNAGRGYSAGLLVNPKARFISYCDLMEIVGGVNVGRIGLPGGQQAFCGYLFYSMPQTSTRALPRIMIVNPDIQLRVTSAANGVACGGCAGISVYTANGDWSIPAGDFLVSGGHIDMSLEYTGANPITQVDGVRLDGGDDASLSKVIQVAGTQIRSVAATGSAYSLVAMDQNNEIQAEVLTNAATYTGSGSITSLTSQP